MKKDLFRNILCSIAALAICLGCNAGQDSIFPRSFHKTCEPVITNPDVLAPVFQKLHSGEYLRIVHIGDSHVRGHSFTVETRRILEEAWGSQAVVPQNITYQTTAIATETGLPGLVYHTIGKNGATYRTFIDQDRIQLIDSLKPDLVIISLGTNDAFWSPNRDIFEENFTALLQTYIDLPQAPQVIVVLPPHTFFEMAGVNYDDYLEELIAKEKTVAENLGLPVIDARSFNEGQADMFVDGIHFTVDGSHLEFDDVLGAERRIIITAPGNRPER